MAMSIAAVAAATGVSVHTVRYYERAGLIPPVPRDVAGRRAFDEASIDWLHYVACLRALGMSVSDIRAYTASMGSGRPDVSVLRRHLDAMRRRRTELGHYIDLVERKLRELDRG